MKLSFFTTPTATSPSTTGGIPASNSALSISNRQENNNLESSECVLTTTTTTATATSTSTTTTNTNTVPSLPKLERLPDYFRDTMDWLIGRSRRKGGGGGGGGAGAATTTAVGQGGRADKENLEFRATAPKKKPPAARGGDASSCSSGSDGSNGRGGFPRQPRKIGGDGGVRESRSADLASISSASGAAVLAVCDTINDVDFDQLVRLPANMDTQEWMASHMLALFHHVNALYGAVCEYCTKDSCPVMCGPGNVQFLWVDEKNKKMKYPAPQYVDCVMSFAERTVRSEDTFPTKYGKEFPPNFEQTLKKLCRLLYHVLAHLHACHWDNLRVLGVGSQAVAVHWHLATFARQFQMLETKDAAGLIDLINNLRRMNVFDDSSLVDHQHERVGGGSAAAAVPCVVGGIIDCNNDEDGREPMDAGSICEPPPRLQEANAQL